MELSPAEALPAIGLMVWILVILADNGHTGGHQTQKPSRKGQQWRKK